MRSERGLTGTVEWLDRPHRLQPNRDAKQSIGRLHGDWDKLHRLRRDPLETMDAGEKVERELQKVLSTARDAKPAAETALP